MTYNYASHAWAWEKASSAVYDLHHHYGYSIMDAYEAAWGGDWSPRLRLLLDSFEEAMFLIGNTTPDQCCKKCSGFN